MRAYYQKSGQEFLDDSPEAILGMLTAAHDHRHLEYQQIFAWKKQIEILKKLVVELPGAHVCFEVSIPRMGKRVDNVIIYKGLVFVLEFKIGDSRYEKHALDQVLDYALDLKCFHEGSHHVRIIPILIATNAPEEMRAFERYTDGLQKPLVANEKTLLEVVTACSLEAVGEAPIDAQEWLVSAYKPTPTIIEAAQALYGGHGVEEISRSDAGAINLSKTSARISSIVSEAKRTSKKVICFVTGVPGAGKTLAGLNIAHESMDQARENHAVFLSGNGPLVEVLREALIRDDVKRSRAEGRTLTKKEAETKVGAFIQNVHHFRDEGIASNEPPVERVVIFDEAQRAWTSEQASSFMARKKGVPNFDRSEPQFLIEMMDRHKDWCCVICLVGSGQEINTGEAGLEEWIASVQQYFTNWEVHCSEDVVNDPQYLTSSELRNWTRCHACMSQDLQLAVSLRSFRAETLSDFVRAVLELDKMKARSLYERLKGVYPIIITREYHLAKQWVVDRARGSERYGVVASSNARRLRPFGIDVKNIIDASNWFLDEKEDVRSSYCMEDVATEFDIQGLELDWTVVCWDADLHLEGTQWVHQSFKGANWQRIKQVVRQRYLLNAYRVLLTRARQGLVIFLPRGSSVDRTRPHAFYDETYHFLTEEIGIDRLGE